ncbi:hypothetical protein [Nocardia ninae]|uniref:Uncharacterized protein n=1 Tax=Nocardia ninae NBRC 108245 TaxID=1210091 RepID=A0A511MJL7_9NOCA|nr:hypothetical protein [Nocardia ninae]GEM40835.1 hypothetical protein NN4_53540 [Nocardia ninae NBRC 108245]
MDWIKLGGVILTGIGVIAGVYYYVANRRRNRVQITISAQSLITDATAAHSLEVRYDGQEVKNPHVALVILENIGPKDVRSTDFDGRNPLLIDLEAKILSLASASGPPFTAHDTFLSLKPTLLPKHRQIRATVVVDGKVDPQVTSSLADTDVSLNTGPSRSGMWRVSTFTAGIVVTALGFTLALLVNLLIERWLTG